MQNDRKITALVVPFIFSILFEFIDFNCPKRFVEEKRRVEKRKICLFIVSFMISIDLTTQSFSIKGVNLSIPLVKYGISTI